MNRLLVILLPIFITSCTTHVKVAPIKCPGEIKLHSFRPGIPFRFEKRVYLPKGRWGESRFSVRSILRENDISCSDLITVSYTLKDEPMDIIYNLLPLGATKTIVVEGTTVDPESLVEEID